MNWPCAWLALALVAACSRAPAFSDADDVGASTDDTEVVPILSDIGGKDPDIDMNIWGPKDNISCEVNPSYCPPVGDAYGGWDGSADADDSLDVELSVPCTQICDDGNACTVDICYSAKGCTHLDAYFSKTYPSLASNSAVAAFSDGFVVATVGLALTQLGKGGDLKWSKPSPMLQQQIAPSAVVTALGGFAAIGTGPNSESPYYWATWLLRTDLSGEKMWIKGFGSDDESHLATSLVAVKDGFAFVGYKGDIYGFGGNSKYSAWLVRLDANGTALWSLDYTSKLDFGFNGKGFVHMYGTAVVALPDGFGLAGDLGGKSDTIFLARTDDAGNKLWLQPFDGGGDGYDDSLCYGLVALPDGFALSRCTWHTTSGWQDCDLIRTDANGKLLWARQYGSVDEVFWFSLASAPSGFALTGRTYSKPNGYPENKADTILLRSDLNGNPLWKHVYASNDGRSVALSDGGFAITGAAPVPASVGQLRLIRTDAYGHATCAESGACFAKTVADCDDSNACTADLCDSNTGCNHLNLPDDAPCAPAKKCKVGKCL